MYVRLVLAPSGGIALAIDLPGIAPRIVGNPLVIDANSEPRDPEVGNSMTKLAGLTRHAARIIHREDCIYIGRRAVNSGRGDIGLALELPRHAVPQG